MHDIEAFALVVAAIALAVTLAILSNRLSAAIRIPAPALFLFAAAVMSDFFPQLNALSFESVQRIVTVALAVILFDGGMHIGAKRFRAAAGPVMVIGVVGTVATAAALGALGHAVFGMDWQTALLLGTALAATDPAVVFSVLGSREIAGRTGTILEGESGANDPVGIALMVVLLTATGTGAGLVLDGLAQFGLQMAIGLAFGIAGGRGMLLIMRRVPLPGAGLYSVRVLALALGLYGVTTVAHGSGFLAVFVAGILLGDERAPYKAEIERFHGALASLGEIVAFTILGLTVDLGELAQPEILVPGLGLGALLIFVVRPLVVGPLVLPMNLTHGERAFILWSGLKGAVPILLGTFAITAGVPEAHRIYLTIFIVVALSVIVQGSLVPAVAHRLGVPMRTVEPEPWAIGVRLRHEPSGVRQFTVAAGATADGAVIRDLPGENVWISLVTRQGQLIPVTGDTMLQAGDQVVVFGEPESSREAARLFT